MAGLALAGVKFTPKVDSAAHLWVARWGVPGERDERMLTDGELWRLVHKVALAFGPRT